MLVQLCCMPKSYPGQQMQPISGKLITSFVFSSEHHQVEAIAVTGWGHQPMAGDCSFPAAAAFLYFIVASHDVYATQKQSHSRTDKKHARLVHNYKTNVPRIMMCGVGMAEGLGASIESLVGQSHLRDLLIQCCQVSIPWTQKPAVFPICWV